MHSTDTKNARDATAARSARIRRIRSISFRLAALALGLFVPLLFAELLLWTLWPVPHPYRGKSLEVTWNIYTPPELFQPGQTIFRPDPGILPGTRSPSRFTLNEFGLRSPRLQRVQKPPGEVRVLCLGGSTTECLYLDDDDAWPELVGRRLQASAQGKRSIDVINAGVSGHTTREHIGTLAQRSVPLQPDVVVILAGTNDLDLQLFTSDYDILRRDSRSRHTHRCPEPGDTGQLARVAACDVSQLVRRFVILKRNLRKTDERGNPVQDLDGRWIEELRVKNAALPEGGHLPDTISLVEYEQNLRTLVGIARAHKAVPVLLTQPTRFRPGLSGHELWLCAYLVYRGRRCPPEEYRDWLDRFNTVTRRIAAETSAVLVDLAGAMSGRDEYFYDANHFNMAGAEKVATTVSEALLANQDIKQRVARE